MNVWRISDGKTYKGYKIASDGSKIILPELAVHDLDTFQNVSARGLDPERTMITQWMAKVSKDLNIPTLWDTHQLTADDNCRDGKMRLIVRRTSASPELLRRIERVAKRIKEFEDSEGPPTEHSALREQRIVRQATLFVIMLDEAGHK